MTMLANFKDPAGLLVGRKDFHNVDDKMNVYPFVVMCNGAYYTNTKVVKGMPPVAEYVQRPVLEIEFDS